MLVFAHRGASGYAPENTLASFKKALEQGVDGIELDVHLSQDGEVVVMHDSLVNRTTNGAGRISNKSLEELKKLDAGNGEKIPTLQEVLDLVAEKALVNIELKGKGTARVVAVIIQEYVQKKKWKYADFLVSSFHHQELKEFERLLPQVRIGALIIGVFVNYDTYIKDFSAYSINIWSKFVRKSIVKKAHEKGLKIIVYTVNDAKEIRRMKELGVDGIISNYPDRVLRLQHEK